MVSNDLVRVRTFSRVLLLVVFLVPLSGCLRPWVGASDFVANLRCGMLQEEVSRYSEVQSARFRCDDQQRTCYVEKGATVLELGFEPDRGLVRYRQCRKFGLTGYETGPTRELCLVHIPDSSSIR
jgi:hypothetical protein